MAAVVALICLAACSSSTSTSGTSATSSGTAAASGKSINIGNGSITPQNVQNVAFIDGANSTFTYAAGETQGIVDAAKQYGMHVTSYYGNYDNSAVLADVQQVMSSGKYGSVIFTPIGPQECNIVPKLALQYHVLVVMVAATLCGQDSHTGDGNWSPGTVQFIGGQSLYSGYVSCLGSGYQLVPGAQNVMLALDPNTSPSTLSFQSAWQTFSATHPSWKLVSTVYTDATTPTSFADVENALQSSQGKSVTLIFSSYVEITAGATKAVQAEHLGSKIKVLDVGGGSAQSVQLIQAGQQMATCPTYPNSMGAAAIKTLDDASKGIQPPKYIGYDAQPSQPGMITKADLSTFKPQW